MIIFVFIKIEREKFIDLIQLKLKIDKFFIWTILQAFIFTALTLLLDVLVDL